MSKERRGGKRREGEGEEKWMEMGREGAGEEGKKD